MVEPPIPEEEPTAEFISRLGGARQRFLAHVVEHGLTAGRRTPADFIRHFPPEVLMEALRHRPELRAHILVPTTGVKQAIAEKKSVESAAEDLRIAIDVGETDAETIVALLGPDERVRYLDNRALWDYVAEGDFCKVNDGIDFEIARAHVSYVIEKALAESLITPRDIVDAIGVDELAALLPREELGHLLAAALERGRDRKPFRDEDLLASVPVPTLTEHVALDVIWRRVVVRRVAEPHGFAEVVTASVSASVAPPPPEPDVTDDEVTPEPSESELDDAVRAFADESTFNGELRSLNAGPHDGE